MKQHTEYDMSVGSATEYDDLIAEIRFPHKFGVIISQEKKEGLFEISVHSFSEQSSEEFDYCKNIDGNKVSLSAFYEALQNAVDRLKRLEKKKEGE